MYLLLTVVVPFAYLGDPLIVEENGEVNSYALHIKVCILAHRLLSVSIAHRVLCDPCTLAVMCFSNWVDVLLSVI